MVANGSTEPPGSDGQREWTRQASSRALGWLEDHREEGGPLDLAARLWERDRDAFGSVLGSAIALRLFLFMVWALVAIVGALNVLSLESVLDRGLEASSTGGELASNISDATRTSGRTGLGLLVSGVFFTLWAGRSLTRVLAATSAGAWSLPARQAKPTLRAVGALTALLVSVLLSLLLIGRLRDLGGFAVESVSLVAVAGVFALAWFVVTWALPSGTPDPGAQLPGALLLGAGFAAVNWFMQAYLPGKIARSSEVVGAAAYSVAMLGYFFAVGRLMAGSFVVNAVLYERFGSLSALFFGLPGVRRIPRRWPRIATFFDLATSPTDGAAGTGPDGAPTGDVPARGAAPATEGGEPLADRSDAGDGDGDGRS